jgi:hypothetical protein
VLSSGKLKVLGAFAFIPLRCSSRVACRGQFSIHTKTRVGKRRTILCAATSFRLRAHQQKQVKTKISDVCAALLRDAQGHRISGQFSSTLRTGQSGPNRRVSLKL